MSTAAQRKYSSEDGSAVFDTMTSWSSAPDICAAWCGLPKPRRGIDQRYESHRARLASRPVPMDRPFDIGRLASFITITSLRPRLSADERARQPSAAPALS